MTNKEILEKMELCCLFAQSHSFPFTFPEDFAKEDLYEFQ